MKADENSKGPVFFGVDVETGGFEPGQHALLAIGCWWSADDKTPRSLNIRVQRLEGMIVEPAAAAVNGWKDDEQWNDLGAVPLKVAVWELLEFTERLQLKTGAER